MQDDDESPASRRSGPLETSPRAPARSQIQGPCQGDALRSTLCTRTLLFISFTKPLPGSASRNGVVNAPGDNVYFQLIYMCTEHKEGSR